MENILITLYVSPTQLGRHRVTPGLRAACAGLAAAVCLCRPVLAAPGSWAQGPDIPHVTSTCASCVHDGALYVMGGHDDKDGLTALTHVWAYDSQAGVWTSRAPLPTGRHYLGQSAVALNGLIYLVGGCGQGKPGPMTREVAVYNPQTDSWTNGAPMPTGRGNMAACAVDGIIYAIAGTTGPGSQLATVEAYDARSNQWTTKRSMPQARWFVTASAVNGIIYVFHGTDVFAYDPKTDRWTTKASHFSPYSWGLLSAEVDGIIYLFGGFTQDWTNGHDFTLAYDAARDQFTARRQMPRTRATAACGVIGGKIYLAAGVSKELIVNEDAVLYTAVDVFDPQGGVTPHLLSGRLISSNSFHLVWEGESGLNYGVESCTSLGSTWTRMTLPTGSTVTATNELVETTCTVPGGEALRFFRVFEAN